VLLTADPPPVPAAVTAVTAWLAVDEAAAPPVPAAVVTALVDVVLEATAVLAPTVASVAKGFPPEPAAVLLTVVLLTVLPTVVAEVATVLVTPVVLALLAIPVVLVLPPPVPE
jgi:hypothetical protein